MQLEYHDQAFSDIDNNLLKFTTKSAFHLEKIQKLMLVLQLKLARAPMAFLPQPFISLPYVHDLYRDNRM